MSDPPPFSGTWSVVSSPDFDDAYLPMEVSPYVRLRPEGRRRSPGGIAARPDRRPRWGPDRVLFSFDGMDARNEVSGVGTLKLNGDLLTFMVMENQGDDLTFACQRRR